MNRNRGNLIVTLLPSLIFAATAAAGWYFYYTESETNESLTKESRSEQRKSTFQLEQLQRETDRLKRDNGKLTAEISRTSEMQSQHAREKAQLGTEIKTLTEKQKSLQTDLEAEREMRTELQATLTRINAEKGEIESNMLQEVKQGALVTAELETQLEQRQKQQKVLHAKMGSVSDEKKQLTSQIQSELKKRQQLEEKIAKVNRDIDHKERALSSAEGEVTELNQKLSDTLQKQVELSGQVEALSQQRKKDSEQFAQLKNLLEKELSDSQVEITQLKNQMTVINLTSGILFTTGSAEIRPAGRKVLALIATSLNAYPDRDVSIEGHTDTVPIGDDSAYASNWELSASRALAAVQYFQNKKRVDPKRLKVVGYGEHRPVASNTTAKERKLNRRIEIRILPPESTVLIKQQSVQKKS